MKRNIKITVWVIAAIIILMVGIVGVISLNDNLREILNPPFEETVIFPDDSRENPADTIFSVNGIEMKMIGVKGGKINCKGLKETIELKDFYIGRLK